LIGESFVVVTVTRLLMGFASGSAHGTPRRGCVMV
jgi:hypothetical protein